MVWPIYVLGTTVAAFIWSSYDAHFKPAMNEWGEIYDPEKGTWSVPDPLIPEVGLNDRGEGVVEYFKSAFDMTDEKKALRNYALLAIVLYTKPWK